MAEELKNAIHQLVETCTDEECLQEVYEFLENSHTGADWWTALGKADQEKTLLSLEQSKSGKVISHEEVSKKIWKKINL